MSQIDTTAIAYQLKRIYGDQITDLFARQMMTYNMFMKSGRKAQYKPGGAGFYFALRQADNEAVGGRAENAYLPEPLPGDGVQGVITPKLIYGALRLSGLAIEAGKGDLMAFADVQGDAISNLYKSLVVDLNRQCWGDGTGLLATLSTTSDTLSTSTTWTITCSNDRGIRYLRKGMIVDFYQSTAIDQSAVAQRIASINPTAKTAEMEKSPTGAGGGTYQAYHPLAAARSYTIAASTVASGSYVVRYGARAAAHVTTTRYELDGLNAMFDDGTVLSSFEGVTISADPEFKANILSNSSVNRELSIDLMLAAVDLSMTRSGVAPDCILTGLGQRRKYFALLAPDIRYASANFVGGYETLKFSQNGQIDMVFDPHAQPNRMYFFPKEAIKKYELTPIGWGGLDGQKMHWRQDYDQATMFLRTYANLGVEQRNALTLLDDLTEPTSLVW
jgi:hypothetical protein